MSKNQAQYQEESTIHSISLAPNNEKEEIVGQYAQTKFNISHSLCPVCQKNSHSQCYACMGKTNLVENQHFDQFVESIMDYKMGRSKAVIQEMLQKRSKHSIKEEPYSSVISSYTAGIQNKQKYQKNSCTMQPTIPYKSLVKPIQEVVVHQGIQCDECHEWPIIGIRYKCQNCANYDLCSRCLEAGKHEQHNFHVIRRPKRQHQIQKLKEAAHKQTANNCLRFNSVIQKFSNIFTGSN